MQHVEQLPLVLVDALDLAVEERVGVDRPARSPTAASRRTGPWPRAWPRGTLAEGRRRRPAGASFASCVEVGDPAVADRLGDQRGEAGVGQQQPAPRRDAVGLVVEPLREHLGEVRQHGRPRSSWEWIAATPLVLCVPTIARLAMRTCFSGPSSIRLIRADAAVVAGELRAHVVEEPAVDLVDDLQVPRGSSSSKKRDRPLLQRLGQQRVVGVGQGPHGQVPGLVPAEPGLVEQDAHQLGDGQRGVRVVELDGDLVGQGRPVVAAPAEAADDVGQRAGDEEVLLHEPQPLAGAAWSRRGRGRGSASRPRPCRGRRRRSRRRLNSPKSKTSGDAAPQSRSVLMVLPP